MSPLALALLRRLAAYALIFAVLLLVVPRVLSEVGVLGPTVDERIESAAGALAAARSYGAPESDLALVASVRELALARDLARHGHARAARHAADRAQKAAFDAQRSALTAEEEARRRARTIVADLDAALSHLEDVFSQKSAGLGKKGVSQGLTFMKEAREGGATLFLAFEQGNYRRVIDQEQETRTLIASVQVSIEALRPAPVAAARP